MKEMSVRLIACGLVVLLALIGPTLAGSFGLLDDRESADVKAIAAAVCDDSLARGRQISRLSTVDKLAEYFENVVIGENHKLADCKRRHLEAINLLNDLLTTSNENVCSETKLILIEDFHNRYVSTHVEQEQNRKENQRDMAPQLLRLLFMHYAMEVNALCKRTLINNLEWDLKEKFGDDIEKRLFELDQQDENGRAAFGAIFKGAMQKFTDLYSLEKYEDVLMIWDLIEDSYLNQKLALEGGNIRDEFDPITGEPVRLLVRIRSRGYLDKIKDHCHYNFKPIYKKLILPIIKLADLGYSNNGEQFKVELEELRSNEDVKRWFRVTQLCEAILPVKFYEDPSLSANDVLVITKKEASDLEAAAESQPSGGETKRPLEYEPDTNSLVGLDQLESIKSSEAQKLVSSIKSNVSARERVIGRAVIQMLRNIKHTFQSTRVGRLLFSSETEKLAHPKSGEKEAHFEHQDISGQLKKSLDQMDDSELLKMAGAAKTNRVMKSSNGASGIGRRRRLRRKGDVDMVQQSRSEALSYQRTKSWSEIFAGWGEVLSALTPSRTHLIMVGGLLILLLTIMVFSSMAITFASGCGK